MINNNLVKSLNKSFKELSKIFDIKSTTENETTINSCRNDLHIYETKYIYTKKIIDLYNKIIIEINENENNNGICSLYILDNLISRAYSELSLISDTPNEHIKEILNSCFALETLKSMDKLLCHYEEEIARCSNKLMELRNEEMLNELENNDNNLD